MQPRYTLGGRHNLRFFTAAEDDRILAQSRGEMVFAQLKRELRTSDAALFRRARELGVALRVGRYTRSYLRRRRMDIPPPAEQFRTVTAEEEPHTYWADRHADPPRIGRDLLLERLQLHHPEHMKNDANQPDH